MAPPKGLAGDGRRMSAVQRLLGETRPGDHVRELLVDDVPTPRPQTAVRVDLDPARVVEDVDRVEDAVADELGRLDEVGVDVEDAEADARVAVLLEQPKGLCVARPVVVRRPELPRVAVRELELELEAV